MPGRNVVSLKEELSCDEVEGRGCESGFGGRERESVGGVGGRGPSAFVFQATCGLLL